MEPKVVIPQKLLKMQYLPLCKERKTDIKRSFQTYSVNLDYIDGLTQHSDVDSYYCQATLFDHKYQKFVGSPWVGKTVQMKNKKMTLNQRFYFYSSIPGKELILIVELITGGKECDKTVGWICMPMINEEELEPTLDHLISFKIPLLHGSPLTLLLLSDEVRGTKLSEHTTKMELSLSLMPYSLLLQITHLVPENVLFDATNVIPGLVSDTMDVVNSTGYTYKPRLQKLSTFILERLCIRIYPSVEEIDKIILENFLKEHEADGSSNKFASKAHIAQRRLQVGIHNGYCFIQECDFYHLLIEPIVTPKAQKSHQRSSSMGSINYSKENGLTLRSDIKLPNVPDDPNIAFVFLIEYTLSLSNTTSAYSNAALTINKSPTSNIAIAWGFIKLSNLWINPSQTVTLSFDPSESPCKVFFLKTPSNFELSFTASSLMKQNKNMSSGHSLGDFSSVASFSTKTYISPETSYLHSPAISANAPKHKSVGDIPMSVIQNETTFPKEEFVNQAYKTNENNINLQEVTLVSSSLPLVPPLLHSFPLESGSAFKAFTKLYWDKLQPVLDHHGKPALILDSTQPYNINKGCELRSPPQKNECMLQLLALSCIEDYNDIPSEIFFTFQFYRFLPVRTESLILKPLTENEDDSLTNTSLVYALLKFQDKNKSLGFQVTYNIDPSELGTGEYRAFQHYLMKQTLHIDLWNGHSLLYFGTVLLPLKYFCRQGKEAVSVTMELDITNCEFPDETLSQTTEISKAYRGKLHVRLASIRHPLTSKSLEQLEETSNDSHIIFPNPGGKNSGISTPVVTKARPIVETSRELTNLLASRCVINCSQNAQDSFSSEDRKRKLARMEAVRNLENEGKHIQVCDDGMQYFLKERERDLLTIESYIQKNKSDMIQSLLHASVTYEEIIYPVIGNKAYFEFVLENPFPEAKEVEISWKCLELSLVFDHKMWQTLRNMHNIPNKVEPINFSNVNSDVPSVILQPKEKVHIPFCYCTTAVQPSHLELFKTASGHHFTSDILSSAPISSNFTTSNVKIRFMTQDQTLLAVLILTIQPLPPSFTHVFKFLSMEHSMFKKVIRIDSGINRNHKVSVKCSDPETICIIQEPHDWEDDISILIKSSTKAAGKLKEFYLFIYKDPYQLTAYQTWLVAICPLQRIDLSCVAGQLMRSSLLIRGTHATNLVKCFSSSSELQLHPADSFLLSPFAVQELSMNIRSLLPGIKHFQITMVNQSLELVLQSWLLVLSCQKPAVSKAFQVHLNIGKETTKRITYRNPYSQDRTFVLHSSHPHLLHFRESRFCVPMGKSYCIGLYFLPQEQIFTTTVFLYLNDLSDKNEETYCIKVMCQ